jgi:D-3-phosphoglycerate dehydrogenase / 2-oxoglutarate reductase
MHHNKDILIDTGIGKVLIAAPIHPVLLQGLLDRGCSVVVCENLTQAEAFNQIVDCVGVITSTRIQLDKELIDAAPGLKWIGRMGSGMEVVDINYAAQKGITVVASPEGNCNAVAEHVLGMLLTLMHRIAWSHSEMAGGLWQREENRGSELEKHTVGIIGFGYTGAAFAKKLSGMDVGIVAYDKYAPEKIPSHIKKCAHIDEIFEEADIISFNVPLQKDTLHYFNDDFLKSMKKEFIIINTSRGKVVSTSALLHGLATGKIKGACLDVFESEPISAMDPFTGKLLEAQMHLPNLIVTPHIAGYTFEALYKMSKVIFDKLTGNFS